MSKKRIDELEFVIQTLDTLYEAGEDCIHPITNKIVSDYDYDNLRKELKKLNPSSKLFIHNTASTLESVSKKIKHPYPFTSIEKANGTWDEKVNMLEDWKQKAISQLSYKEPMEKWAVCSLKRDGVALGLYYEKGKLVKAGLRPRKGIEGEDVTENVKYITGIPTELPLKITCSIRGEVECKKSVFQKLNSDAKKDGDQVFANPRNYTAGSIRQFKDPSITGKRQLSFTAYAIEGLDNPPYKTAKERAIWCNKELNIPFVRVENFTWKLLQNLEKLQDNLDYEIDGVVIEIDNLEDQEQMGRHGNSYNSSPKGKIAWKPNELSMTTICRNVRWQVGRSGKVTPVAEFDGVLLDGTIVKQCTCHNVGIVSKNNIGIGAKLRIIKSGKIIPKITEVISPSNKLNIPTNCPSCNSKLLLVSEGDGEDLYCENKNCGSQNVGSFINYLSVLGVKGIAESTIESLIESKLIKTFDDFYKLDLQSLIDNSFTKRSAILILARIWMISNPEDEKDDGTLYSKVLNRLKEWRGGSKIKIPIASFIQALGIPNASKGTSRNLVQYFNADLNKIIHSSIEEFIKVPDIGDVVAKELHSYFKDNKTLINSLLEYIELDKPKTGKLTGKTFVFTGGFEEGKEHWIKRVEDEGGKVSGSVSKKVDYVVIGENSGSKEQKAIELNIKRISSTELEKML